MANGGTVRSTLSGNVQNRALAKIRFTLTEQYAEHFQDSDTYSLTLTEDSRFVRSFTTGGPGAWKRIAGWDRRMGGPGDERRGASLRPGPERALCVNVLHR